MRRSRKNEDKSERGESQKYVIRSLFQSQSIVKDTSSSPIILFHGRNYWYNSQTRVRGFSTSWTRTWINKIHVVINSKEVKVRTINKAKQNSIYKQQLQSPWTHADTLGRLVLSKASEWKRPRRLQSVCIGEIEEEISPDQGRCNDNVFLTCYMLVYHQNRHGQRKSLSTFLLHRWSFLNVYGVIGLRCICDWAKEQKKHGCNHPLQIFQLCSIAWDDDG